jgi:hypothetical protein
VELSCSFLHFSLTAQALVQKKKHWTGQCFKASWDGGAEGDRTPDLRIAKPNKGYTMQRNRFKLLYYHNTP